RGARQPRLRLHRPPATRLRRCAVQQPARHDTGDRLRRARACARRGRLRRRHRKRAGGGAGTGARGIANQCRRDRDGSREVDDGRRRLVGRADRRGVGERGGAPRTRRALAAARVMNRTGINPLTWRDDDRPSLGAEIPLETCLAQAAAAGYAGVELGHKFPRQAAVLGPLLERHGLALASGWYSLRLLERSPEAELAAMQPHLELLAALGCEVMV